MRKTTLGLTLGTLCLGAGVPVLAAPIVLTPTANYQKDMSWQEINQTTYTFVDGNANNLVDAGETVTFTVEMDKEHWGKHRFDALKFWIADESSPSTFLLTETGTWDFSTYWSRGNDAYSWRDWQGGTREFSFDYTFSGVGSYSIIASVMCSADLSGLYNDGWGTFDRPTQNDWNAWTPDAHRISGWRQGETEIYRLTVAEPPAAVPEPGTLALFGLGLVGLAGLRRFRKAK